jgi:hypothetical protein
MQRGKVLVRAMFRAATNRVSLCLSGVAALTALMLQSGTLGTMALGGYLVAVAVDFGRPRRWREAVQDVRRRPPPLPSPHSLSDSQARDLLSRIEKARTERLAVEKDLPPYARLGAETLAERACVLEASAVRLLELLERLSRYLGVDPILPVREEILRVERAAARALPPARAEYESALRALKGRLGSLEYAEDCRALVLAKLEAIAGGLEALPPALVAVELRQSAAAAFAEEPPLPGLLEELTTLEEAARTVAAPAEA